MRFGKNGCAAGLSFILLGAIAGAADTPPTPAEIQTLLRQAAKNEVKDVRLVKPDGRCHTTVPENLQAAVQRARRLYRWIPANNQWTWLVKFKFTMLHSLRSQVHALYDYDVAMCRVHGQKFDAADWQHFEATQDAANAAAAKLIFADIGWPDRKRFGSRTRSYAFDIVFFADNDTAFQEKWLPDIRGMYSGHEDFRQSYARLYDKLQVRRHKPQLYGTVGAWHGKVWTPAPIADEAHLDARRKAMGMEPVEVDKHSITQPDGTWVMSTYTPVKQL